MLKKNARMKNRRGVNFISISVLLLVCAVSKSYSQSQVKQPLTQLEVVDVKVSDTFWRPKFEQWRTTTATDVFDKFEGRHESIGEPRDAFKNFDLVAEGKRNIGLHHGPPWYDGLVYESIRGVADFLAVYPDSKLEKRIDDYIDRIAAAQKSDPDGYINTYTDLMEPSHRWGLNGGMQRWQHDVYNAGMLLEAGVHYYKATGKTKLLNVAVKYANYMYKSMGPAPKLNVVPAHSGPEEAVMKLYWLFKNEPGLKKKMDEPVQEDNYYQLASFWIENRGVHCGMPDWDAMGNPAAEQWIRDNKYNEPQYGNHSRPTWGSYAQDKVPFLKQESMEGHAVRATLFTTGAAAVAEENKSPQYLETLSRLWDNMTGCRMFITGGVGAIAYDEKFGPDYFLPNDAYLETCAAVGAGFFSQRMNQLTGDAKYMDEFERSLYNGVLTTISASGTNYTYQNPPNAGHHSRWGWHDCPCCPPMFLKMMSAFPGFIYAHTPNELYVNLYVGSEAKVNFGKNKNVSVKQVTQYPWEGKVSIFVSPESKAEFALKVRIPGWAVNKENPMDLYKSHVQTPVYISVNGEKVNTQPVDGYVTLNRTWKKGDRVELVLPMEPRFVYANDLVNDLKGLVAVASGPLVYCLEEGQNPGLEKLRIDTKAPTSIRFRKEWLNGINVITGTALDDLNKKVEFTAIPYYAIGNLKPGNAYKMWTPYLIK